MRSSIVDSHCDALLKLWENKNRDYRSSEEIDANFERLKAGNVTVQFFAIFVEPFIKQDQKFQVVMEQVELFYQKVLTVDPAMRHIKQWSDLQHLKEDEIGAVLTLEGVDSIGDDLTKLAILHELGVLSVGLTWNQANLCADGIGEARGAGLTSLGKEVVEFNNKHQILTDVSHLSLKGFWDVMDLAAYPIASHSNARQICDHPRNLYNDQIQALVQKDGYIGLVFYPTFLTTQQSATIKDLLKHIDHMCALGAENCIGFGSDFDGISDHVIGLEHSGNYQTLVNELCKHYSATQVQQFLIDNFARFTKRFM
ncbi:dipeptidase [Halalkalibacter wakoensis JCM 9140]|uniref:Dipeptidase n=1 Tax=Halalkalibacter wakoensis JCM 9140 TaxID=1236970 RepID=W4PYB7_9BACI|nr:dipeptidase [Halalkalibacter wakoensis]GAE24448.1 dipeptidase [Halalkalibacter wakoensis JCM 9140]